MRVVDYFFQGGRAEGRNVSSALLLKQNLSKGYHRGGGNLQKYIGASQAELGQYGSLEVRGRSRTRVRIEARVVSMGLLRSHSTTGGRCASFRRDNPGFGSVVNPGRCAVFLESRSPIEL